MTIGPRRARIEVPVLFFHPLGSYIRDKADRPRERRALVDWVRTEIWEGEGSSQLPGKLAERIVERIFGAGDVVEPHREGSCAV
jgi:hypothetical protein